MFTPADAPLALVGYAPAVATAAAAALRDLGLQAIGVPAERPQEVVAACLTLRFGGALVAPGQGRAWLDAGSADSEARRVGRVDALSFHGAALHGTGGATGTFAYAEALSDTLEASGYVARGASLAVLGHTAADLAVAAPLARLGFTDIGLVADSAPEAERAIRDLPSGLRIFPLSRRDGSVRALASRSDLIVLTSGELPHGLLEPYHTLIDLTGRAQGQGRNAGSGASVLDLETLALHHTSRQLLHATGQRYEPSRLVALAEALHSAVQV